MTTRPGRGLRRAAVAAALVLATPLLAACGGSDSAEDDSAATETETESSAFPATIEHKFGETEVTAAPERVVVVGLVEQDALLALGIVPVATTKWFGEAPGFIFPWAEDELGDGEVPEVLDATNGIPVEEVAALAPDLIIGIYSGMTDKEYELLSKIAPTIAQPAEYVDYGVPWDEATQMVGDAVGRPDEAAQVIEDVQATVADYREQNPDFEGRQVAMVTPWEGLFIYGPEDPRGRILGELGFEFPTVLLKEQQEEFGWSVSAERTSDLDELDAVVWLDLTAADQAMTDLWEKTTPARNGAYIDIDDSSPDYYVATSFITPLSIPWMLERFVPQLAAAIDNDPATEVPAVTD